MTDVNKEAFRQFLDNEIALEGALVSSIPNKDLGKARDILQQLFDNRKRAAEQIDFTALINDKSDIKTRQQADSYKNIRDYGEMLYPTIRYALLLKHGDMAHAIVEWCLENGYQKEIMGTLNHYKMKDIFLSGDTQTIDAFYQLFGKHSITPETNDRSIHILVSSCEPECIKKNLERIKATSTREDFSKILLEGVTDTGKELSRKGFFDALKTIWDFVREYTITPDSFIKITPGVSAAVFNCKNDFLLQLFADKTFVDILKSPENFDEIRQSVAFCAKEGKSQLVEAFMETFLLDACGIAILAFTYGRKDLALAISKRTGFKNMLDEIKSRESAEDSPNTCFDGSFKIQIFTTNEQRVEMASFIHSEYLKDIHLDQAGRKTIRGTL